MGWPNDLGLLLYNGAKGLAYYSSQASRLFVSNAGIIVTVAVGGYLFPKQTMQGVGGAVAIRGATWLTKKVDEKYKVHVADLFDRFLMALPTSVTSGYVHASLALAKPQAAVSTARANNPQLLWVNESIATELMSPMLEETIYRVGLQEGLALGLKAVGVPVSAAAFLSVAIASSLFAAGHNLDQRHAVHREILISGIGFGLMMYVYGLPAAVVAHAANNAGVRLERALRP